MAVVFFEHDRAKDVEQHLGLGPMQLAGSPQKRADDNGRSSN
jgi:hypothetical protein